jgi:GTPase
MLEPRKMDAEDLAFGHILLKTTRPVMVAINKVDRIPPDQKPSIDEIKLQMKDLGFLDSDVMFISALSREGIVELKKKLISLLPMGQPFFPIDQVTDRWERFYVAELIREQIFHNFTEEVPHAAAVAIEEFSEKPDRKDFIKAIIYVETEGQKRIIIGNKGSTIKNVGQRARTEIETLLGRPVFLELEVKIQKNWRKNPEFIKKLQEMENQGLS